MHKVIGKYIYVSSLTQAVNVIVNFAYSLVVVKLLGAAGYGGYAVFYNSLALAVLLLGFNLPSVITFFVTNKKINEGKLLALSMVIALANALLLMLVLIKSGSWGFAIHIFPNGTNKPLWIFFFCALFFLMQTNQVLAAFLNAHKIFISPAIFSLAGNIALVAFWFAWLAGLIRFALPLFDLIWWVSIFFYALNAIYFFYLLATRTGIRVLSMPAGLAELRLISGFAIVVYLCNTLQFLNYKMDIWFVNHFAGAGEAGVYALALSLSQLIWILPNAISSVLLNYYQVHDKAYSMQLGLRYGNLAIYCCFLAAIALLIVYYYALPFLYGNQFSQVFMLCAVLFAGTVPFTLAIIIANLNSGIGYLRINLYGTIFTFIAGIILNIVLIPVYGTMGAATGKVISYLAGTIFHLVITGFLYKLPWVHFFRLPRLRDFVKPNIVNE